MVLFLQPALSSTSKRSKGNVKRAVYRRATQSMTSMAARKAPILPARLVHDESPWKMVSYILLVTFWSSDHLDSYLIELKAVFPQSLDSCLGEIFNLELHYFSYSS